MFKKIIRFFSIFILLLNFTVFIATHAESVKAVADEVPCCSQLNDLEKSISDNLVRQKELSEQIKKEKDEESKATLVSQLDALKSQQRNLEQLFSKIALGGVNTQNLSLSPKDESNYDWQQEVLTIVKPLFSELRTLTEKPRKRDQLIIENSELDEQIETLNKGLAFLNNIKSDSLDQNAVKRLAETKKHWEQFREDLINLKNTNTLQLKEFEGPKISITDRIKTALESIFLGRGLLLFIALMGAGFVVLIFNNGVNYVLRIRERKEGTLKKRKTSLRFRLLLICYRLVVYVTAILTFLSIIYAKGDMVLFGLAVLILFIGIISLRNYAPRYMSELKLFLNMGTVREGERIMYKGIPWEVVRIGFYCNCVNPLLENGRIRIALSELPSLVSRPIMAEESWFPTEVGDKIFLPSGDFAEVKRQTPEMVYLDSFFREIMIPASQFYGMGIENLKFGFYVMPTFGLNYQHINTPVQEVAEKFSERVTEKLKSIGVGHYIRDISVQVRRIVYGVAIEYTIVIEMMGESGDNYFKIERMSNHACLEVCQEMGWKLPTQQITMSNKDNKHE